MCFQQENMKPQLTSSAIVEFNLRTFIYEKVLSV